jgi:hypothetical protein
MKNETPKSLGESLKTVSVGSVIIISVPGAEKPWFVYDKKTRKSSHGFATSNAAESYLKTEFGN